MKFEKLRKSHKKEIIMGALAICIIGGALTFATTKAKYKLTQSIDLVKGTINYKPYDFKIMAMYKSEDGTNYTEINTMPSSGYVINEEKTYCTTDNKTKVKGKIKTVNGIHGLYNITKSDKCYLYFEKKTSIDNAQELLAKVQSEAKTTTPNFSQSATTDEGIFKSSDGMYGGTSYYWRGAVTNNYVTFAGFCWRIIRINGDGTLRLIYDGSTCHANGTSTSESIVKTSIAYNSSWNRSEYVGWTYSTGNQRTLGGSISNAKSQTDSWFSANITGMNLSKVTDGKYCNDRNVASEYSWSSQPRNDFYYAGYERLIINKKPTFNCTSGDTYIIKVGLITADEIVMAGGVLGTGNSSYYLYNGNYYWTMTPGSSSSTSGTGSGAFCMSPDGYPNIGTVSISMGIRPVINLKADTLFTSGGTGTQSNPYIV